MLSKDQANEYRSRLEEWLSNKKTYCPNPTCSTFISDRELELFEKQPRAAITLHDLLRSILVKMDSSPSARFFRQELTNLPDRTWIVEIPIYLTDMKAKIEQYTSLGGFMQDVQLLWSNAQHHGRDHPIAQAAMQLFNICSEELGRRLLVSNTSSFQCPKCKTGICFDCKKIEHSGQACDNAAREEELAMLAKFGYKQCPRCGHGVRKMFGCSHV